MVIKDGFLLLVFLSKDRFFQSSFRKNIPEMNQAVSSSLPVRILIIDDDEDDFWLISDFIQDIPKQKFQVDWCPNYKMGSAALRDATHDIYFIDYHLGAKTGIDLLKEAVEYN